MRSFLQACGEAVSTNSFFLLFRSRFCFFHSIEFENFIFEYSCFFLEKIWTRNTKRFKLAYYESFMKCFISKRRLNLQLN